MIRVTLGSLAICALGLGSCARDWGAFHVSSGAGDGSAASGGGAAARGDGSGGTAQGGAAAGATGAGGAAPAGGAAGESGAGGAPDGAGGSGGGGAMGGTGATGGNAMSGASGVGASGGAGASGSAGTGGGFQCASGLRGSAMLEVETPQGSYCIDRVEATNADYEAFLDSSPNPGALHPPNVCTWNGSFTPALDSASCTMLNYDPTGKPQHPIACVDWCDAYAYCAWAGKRLCGSITGGPNAPVDHASAAKSQWYGACSFGGAREFPYLGPYRTQACNGYDLASGGTLAVGTLGSCNGGYAGLFDMSGNVWEWEDSCSGTAGAADTCLQRGGGFMTWDVGSVSYGLVSLRCNSSIGGPPIQSAVRRDERSHERGLRCCSAP